MSVDRRIDELPAASDILVNDLFVLEQSGAAKKLTGQMLKSILAPSVISADAEGVAYGTPAEASYNASTQNVHFKIPAGAPGQNGSNGTDGADGANGLGIYTVALISGDHTPGTYDTYRMTFTDGTYYDFNMWNGSNGTNGAAGATGTQGVGITNIEWTSGTHAPGTYDTYTVYKSDSTTFTFQVYNGLNGDGELPTPSLADNGKFLMVDNGAWAMVTFDPNPSNPSMTTPKMDGTANVGTEMKYARGDHVHPKDTSKEDVSNKVTSMSASSTDTQYPSAKAVYEAIQQGPGGVTDYDDLTNRPQISGVTLTGNKTPANLGLEAVSNKVTSMSSASTDDQYPSAKCVYNAIQQGGVTDYDALSNRPQIAGITLTGNKTLANLGAEATANKVTSVSSSSTDTQYPTAKCLYTMLGNVETLLAALR